jgi:hypothetical protein
MQTVNEIATLIERHADMMRLLRAVEKLDLPDCWIGAGFIRNAVWDSLHQRVPNCSLLNDVDVVFLSRAFQDSASDVAFEARLQAMCPNVPWSVKNQARMHVRNGDTPYSNTESAIAVWPETATAVAARLRDGRLELLAPHGIADLVGLIVRPTPAFVSKLQEFESRVQSKNWKARWPRLTVLSSSGSPS